MYCIWKVQADLKEILSIVVRKRLEIRINFFEYNNFAIIKESQRSSDGLIINQ